MKRVLNIPSMSIERIDSWSILEGMLEYSGHPADVVICSFAIAEGWIKRLWRMKENGRIKTITVILDYAVMIRHRERIILLKNIVDKLFLQNTHAKLIMTEIVDFTAVAVMSANATMNYRTEAYYVTDRPEEINKIREDLEKIYDNSRAIITGKRTGKSILHR